MTARVLVVDDIPANVKLLEARLMAEYFHVITASSGQEALEICERDQCDIVLLDVMMPEMDGFEVCHRLKQNPKTMHLPVVMVTALDQPNDRVRGLEAGADDFLTKPVNDLALITRVKSLVRLKLVTDELRMRASSGETVDMDAVANADAVNNSEIRGNIIMVDDRASSYERTVKFLSQEHDVAVITDPQDALFQVVESNYDVVVISLSLTDFDALRLCSHLRSLERTRSLPILIVADEGQESQISRALELGVNDYIIRPLDKNELLARVRTQIKRKRYNDCLRNSVQNTIEMAVTDGLTGLHNRRYLDSHLATLFDKAKAKQSHLSTVMCDIDHFKRVNDTYGHDVGDEVIREFAERLKKCVRGVDLASRYGGEEFVVVMPDTDVALASIVAERIRASIADHPFIVEKGAKQLAITVSVGVSSIVEGDEEPLKLLKRADIGLYTAKKNGRNQVIAEAA
ncbi:MAG: PleD family two-component system response regulator [Rhizobiaceae bacterium]|nr:PleD family two-component system response regulator [Rhizobiaceae bacterium]